MHRCGNALGPGCNGYTGHISLRSLIGRSGQVTRGHEAAMTVFFGQLFI